MDNQEQSNSVERISIAVDGTEANGSIGIISLSDDGQLIPFESDASNLTDTDTNNATDIFVYDGDESVELISLATDSTPANGSSSNAVISGDGSYVTFNSSATNLVDNDTNDLRDIFLRDRNSKTTELISVARDGTAANGLSLFSDINDDGDYLAFQSFASNLVSGDTNSVADIFLRDRVNGTTKLISVSPEGTAANAASELGSISDDGRYISFSSAANNLVADDRNNTSDIFVYDRDDETTTLVSVGLEGAFANGDSSGGLISGNGRYVVYQSNASNLVENDTNSASDIFVYDLVDETTRLVSLTNADESANGSSTNASISDDGRYVAFLSDADNLVEDDTNSGTDIFIRDLEAGTTTKVDGDSFPLLSGNGEALVFNSSSSEFGSFSSIQLADAKDKVNFIDRLSIDSLRRFYNSQGGYHLYSVGDGETPILSSLSATNPDSLNDELEKFDVLTSNLDALTGEELENVGIVSVYQFFNSDTDAYLYTTDETEIDFVDTLDNYSDSSVAFYAFESEPTELEIETIPVFRMLNTSTGTHFYTADQNELDYIQDNLNNFEMENQGEAVFYVPDL